MRTGGIDFFTPSALVVATLVPVAAINAVGFAFSDYDQVWGAMDGKLGAHVRAAMAKVAPATPSRRCGTTASARSPAAAKPIESRQGHERPEDPRAGEPAVASRCSRRWAPSPTSLQFSEVYSALQTKIVDAQENPLPIIQVAKLYEVQKYCSLTNHIWDGFWFIANGRAWERLPADLKAIVTQRHQRCRPEAARGHRQAQRDRAGRPAGQGPGVQQADAGHASAPSCARPASTSEWKKPLRRRGLGRCSKAAVGKLA